MPGTPPAVTIAEIYSYGVKTYFGTAVKAIGQRGDRLILAWFVPSSMVAAYAIAIALRDAAALPITAHATVLRNRFIDVASSKDLRALGQTLHREVARWFILMAVVAAAVAAVTPLVVPYIYGEQLRPAVPLFSILFATLPTLAIVGFCSTLMLAMRRAGAVSAGYLAGAALNCIGLYAGAKMGGAVGAAWGALVASLASAAWWLVAAGIRPAEDRA
jgi:O-antigen/teichoic acid export membrane protein